MDQNEGLLYHPADCARLFEGNKVKEKKDINLQDNDLEIEKELAGLT